jgi:probable phosphoglycerate mutase
MVKQSNFASYICGFALLLATQIAMAAETTFLLVRHGQTNWNIDGRYSGWTDIPLNDEGMKQAERLSDKIRSNHPDLAAIYSSDLSRAYFTALPTSRVFQLPIEKRIALREIFWGIGEGLTPAENDLLYKEAIEDLRKSYPERRERWNHALFSGAETYNHLLARVQNELKSIAEKHPGEKVAIFSHGRVIKTLLGEVLDTEKCPYPENCGIVVLHYDSEIPDQPFTFLRIENISSN